MTYEVSIKETLQRSICVEAKTEQEAIEIADRMMSSGELILTADDYIDREYEVSPYRVRVVSPDTKNGWIRNLLGIRVNDNITLQLSKNTFIWVERFIEDGVDTLLVEVHKGYVDRIEGIEDVVFQEEQGIYRLDLSDIRKTVDILIELFDYYVKPIVKVSDVVVGVLGAVVATGLLSTFSVLMALI
jgi:hypothetical protein